jgi:lauroyl/myristoyl acyltransferase
MMLVFGLVTLLLHSTNYDHVTISAQKCFFGYDQLYSVTLMMTEHGLPSFDNLISSCVSRFESRWLSSDNNVIANLCSLQL